MFKINKLGVRFELGRTGDWAVGKIKQKGEPSAGVLIAYAKEGGGGKGSWSGPTGLRGSSGGRGRGMGCGASGLGRSKGEGRKEKGEGRKIDLAVGRRGDAARNWSETASDF